MAKYYENINMKISSKALKTYLIFVQEYSLAKLAHFSSAFGVNFAIAFAIVLQGKVPIFRSFNRLKEQ
ncbi:MAG: hypothetical protein QM535_15060 [Limnohabitans sp.]|nr:hypothetical protein [Limnohabitans sp.]